MGLYEQYVFAPLMDSTLGSKSAKKQRQNALAAAYGDILEIGFGTGRNLPHYPQAVTSLTAIDPATLLSKRRNGRIARAHMPVKFVERSAETLPFEAGRFDCVVSTWTLCTISDAVGTIREIERVLKAEGLFLFLEHGRSDHPGVAKWQDRLNPLQKKFACGCNMNRSIDALIQEGGMTVDSLERYLMEGTPRILGEMYLGVARPSKGRGNHRRRRGH